MDLLPDLLPSYQRAGRTGGFVCMTTQPITLDQLARLYRARNDANRRMSQAMRSKDAALIRLATAEASNFNRAYDAAQRAYKRQQKSERRASMRTQMIRFYIDVRQHQEQT